MLLGLPILSAQSTEWFREGLKKTRLFIHILWIRGGGSADVDKREGGGGSADVDNLIFL